MIGYDGSNQKYKEDGTWLLLMLFRTTNLRISIELYFYKCKIDKFRWKILGLIYIVVGFAALCHDYHLEVERMFEERKK